VNKRIVSLVAALVLICIAVNCQAVSFPDYLPVISEQYGLKTYVQTYGGTSSYTSQITGTHNIPYTTGSLTGVTISNFGGTDDAIFLNNGDDVKFLGGGGVYVSTDAFLTSHPSSWSFGEVSDGQIIDQGIFYLVASDLSSAAVEDDQLILFSIQNISVLNGTYQNALVMWWLDSNYGFSSLDFHGKDVDLGLVAPTGAQTDGHSVTDFDIFAFGVGPIATGDVSAMTGNVDNLFELQSVATVPEPSSLVAVVSAFGFLGGIIKRERLRK